jgi:hypothetical protein
MDHLTDRSIRRTTDWLEFSTNTYLDHRHRNWVMAEELGDVVFVAQRGVVLVHRERAEHIARALRWRPEATVPERAFALSTTPTRPLAPDIATATKSPTVIVTAPSRWRTACGWLGILAGAAVFVAALAVGLDDPALVVAVMLALRGGQFTLAVDS